MAKVYYYILSYDVPRVVKCGGNGHGEEFVLDTSPLKVSETLTIQHGEAIAIAPDGTIEKVGEGITRVNDQPVVIGCENAAKTPPSDGAYTSLETLGRIEQQIAETNTHYRAGLFTHQGWWAKA